MGFVSDLWHGITGETAADAATSAADTQYQGIQDAIAEQRRAAAEGLGFLKPYEQIGQDALKQTGFLTDPTQQFEYLQSNPLFKLALENANKTTQNQAAAGGRLSAGDTLQQLSNNVLLSASPLIQSQKSSIMNLLKAGAGIAGAEANTAINVGNTVSDLITSGADALAAGETAAANAQTQGAQNLFNLGGASLLFASDKRLKKNINLIDNINGYNIYSWTWNKLAESMGLFGDSYGVIAQYVFETNPDAIAIENGYMKVNYSMLGIEHGN